MNSELQLGDVKDPEVLRAMRTVPRARFVPPELAGEAGFDGPLPIGCGQTISQPYIVARMTELIRPFPGMRALEIGAGSGYQAAVLAELGAEVYSVEIIPELARRARLQLDRAGYPQVRIRQADGYHGWPEHAPYDAVVVTAAAERIPPPLIEQLREGGRLIIPLGRPWDVQQLVLVEKTDGEPRSRPLMAVRFVPFTRSES